MKVIPLAPAHKAVRGNNESATALIAVRTLNRSAAVIDLWLRVRYGRVLWNEIPLAIRAHV